MNNNFLTSILKPVTDWLDKHSHFTALGLLRLNGYPWLTARLRSKSQDIYRVISEIRVADVKREALLEAQLADIHQRKLEVESELALFESVQAPNDQDNVDSPFKLSADRAFRTVQTLTPNHKS